MSMACKDLKGEEERRERGERDVCVWEGGGVGVREGEIAFEDSDTGSHACHVILSV